jgi:mono/diheme cytochrome c family protein
MQHGGPMHWRGDRTGGETTNRSPLWDGDPLNALDENKAFLKFNPAFVGLLGRTNQLSADDMQAFATFILRLQQPPSPIRALENTLTAAQQLGSDTYFGPITDGAKSCNGCHTVDQASGFFGTGGLSTFEGETQHFKVPHLRNVYQKVGMFGMPAVSGIPASGSPSTPQIRGFGYLHDGAIDTLLDFVRAMAFTFPGQTEAEDEQQRAQVVDFMFAMESDFAPIVGQQITLTPTNAAVAGPRVDLLVQRAGTPYADPDRSPNNECDLVVKGRVSGDTRGWWMSAPGVFTPDEDGAPAISDANLRLLAGSLGGDLTYTCVPPGSGPRAGIDRGGVGDDSQPDGIRDFSQCGDVSNDGVDTSADVALMRTWLSGVGNMPARFKCNVSGPAGNSDAACNIADVAALRRALAGLGPALTQGCAS